MYSTDKLNVSIKTRSNPFSWRGQFTPELIEYFAVPLAHSGANPLLWTTGLMAPEAVYA
jgi:hypothetical protein